MIIDRMRGYVRIGGGDGPDTEFETIWCGHCSAHTRLGPRSKPDDTGTVCNFCHRYACARCATRMETQGMICEVIEDRLDAYERGYHARRWMEEALR